MIKNGQPFSNQTKPGITISIKQNKMGENKAAYLSRLPNWSIIFRLSIKPNTLYAMRKPSGRLEYHWFSLKLIFLVLPNCFLSQSPLSHTRGFQRQLRSFILNSSLFIYARKDHKECNCPLCWLLTLFSSGTFQLVLHKRWLHDKRPSQFTHNLCWTCASSKLNVGSKFQSKILLLQLEP